VQLGFFSVIFAVFSLMGQYEEFNDKGLLHGYNFLTWVIVIVSASGGLLVALVIKYCDNIIKGFATAFGIVVTSVISFLFLGSELSIPFICGAANVISSIFIYSGGEIRTPAKTQAGEKEKEANSKDDFAVNVEESIGLMEISTSESIHPTKAK
jgi:UDP-sugar transporter A1/2/3